MVGGGSRDNTVQVAQSLGMRVIRQSRPGFGIALLEGFRASGGRLCLTLDADFSHDPSFIPNMLKEIDNCDVVVASRYVKGGSSNTTLFRQLLSRLFNLVFQFGLSLPIKDNTGNFRLYKKEVLDSILKDEFREIENFAILPAVLVKVFAKGWLIKEIPFHYSRRKFGSSNFRLFKFLFEYIRFFMIMERKKQYIIR